MIDPFIAGALGEALAKKLAACTMLAKDDLVARSRAIHVHDSTGVGSVQPAGYWYKEVGYFWRVQSFAQTKTLDGDERATTLLALRGPHVLGCRTTWRDAIAAVRTLLATPGRDGRWYTFAATSDDGAFGFIFTSHVGYVARELHDDETVYKVSRWHPPPE